MWIPSIFISSSTCNFLELHYVDSVNLFQSILEINLMESLHLQSWFQFPYSSYNPHSVHIQIKFHGFLQSFSFTCNSCNTTPILWSHFPFSHCFISLSIHYFGYFSPTEWHPHLKIYISRPDLPQINSNLHQLVD